MTGYTLIEVLVVVLMAGILAAITAPSWVGFLERQRLNSATSEVYQAMRRAQSRAEQEKVTWQASFREQGGVVQWAVHREDATDNAAWPNNVGWNNLDASIRISDSNTTLRQDDAILEVQFNHKGNVNGQSGKITLDTGESSQVKRCAIVSTLLGAMRTGKDNGCT